MKTLPLTNSPLVALVDDQDYDAVKNYTWSLSHYGYPSTFRAPGCGTKTMFPSAGQQSWHSAEWFRVWLHLMRYSNPMKNPNPKENPPEEPTQPPIWPGDIKPIPPGTYPDPRRDEVTEVPLVR